MENETWELVKLPKGYQAFGCKWILHVKYDGDGNVECFKGRLVTQGYSQKHGIDYDKIFFHQLQFLNTYPACLCCKVQTDSSSNGCCQ